MSDVSKLAGVSKMTVSRVLAEPELVSPATRTRVLQAVDQLGYVPDRVAASLSSRRTNFIAAIVPTLINSNFADTAQGLAEALRVADYQLLIGYTMYDLNEEERVIRTMLARRPDALVVAGIIHTRAAREMLVRADIPIVELWDVPEHPIDHAVGFSNFDVGRAAGRYLISRGYTKIGGIGSVGEGDVRDFRGESRLLGFSASLHEAGLSDERILRTGYAPVGHEHGARAMVEMLDSHPDVDAVFCVSDISAFGALMECHRRGMSVPRDIGIMGFGNFDIGRQTHPAITTIGVNATEIGKRAGELLLSVLHPSGEVAGPIGARVDVGFQLIERGTLR
jgi:LacI family gluconate utilization system Gnt-I transcriptional repressor